MLSSSNRYFLWFLLPAAVNPNGIKTLLANYLSVFFLNGKPSDLRSVAIKYLDCTIFESWVFDNLIIVDKLYAKVLQTFTVCLSASINLCRKLASSLESPIIFDDNCRVTSVALLCWT